jgi:hypothetical protein
MTSHNNHFNENSSPQLRFKAQLKSLTRQISGRALDSTLEEWLNTHAGPESEIYQNLKASCLEGVSQAWLCNREGGGIKYGRVFKANEDLDGFSVDVVEMENIAGPHHTHPQGEIDLIMPIEGEARFDNHPAGWKVYPEQSSHQPTVSLGRALILYLLPNGAIEFTK